VSNKASASASRNTAILVVPPSNTEKSRIITVVKNTKMQDLTAALDSSCFTFNNEEEYVEAKVGTAKKELPQSQGASLVGVS